MSDILAQYGRVTIYNEPNHPSPIYHVEGNIEANPYGDLAALLEDDSLEEVMYNGGTQCVKVAHRDHGMCRTNIWIDDIGLGIDKVVTSTELQTVKEFAGFPLMVRDDG